MESELFERVFTAEDAASMEPRPHERGKLLTLDSLIPAEDASMEPRPHERGKAAKPPICRTFARLQWSHVLTNVERLFEDCLFVAML